MGQCWNPIIGADYAHRPVIYQSWICRACGYPFTIALAFRRSRRVRRLPELRCSISDRNTWYDIVLRNVFYAVRFTDLGPEC